MEFLATENTETYNGIWKKKPVTATNKLSRWCFYILLIKFSGKRKELLN